MIVLDIIDFMTSSGNLTKFSIKSVVFLILRKYLLSMFISNLERIKNRINLSWFIKDEFIARSSSLSSVRKNKISSSTLSVECSWIVQ
jgi:hypothetical protein